MTPEILSSLIGSLLGTAAFWIAYRVVMFNRKSHRVGRAFLLAALILPLVVPPLQQLRSLRPAAFAVSYRLPEQLVGQVVKADQAPEVPAALVVLCLYAAVALFLLLRQLLGAIRLMRKLDAGDSFRLHGIRIYSRTGYGPGSIGCRVFFPDDAVSPEILLHETGHIRLGHRFDLAIANAICCLCWLNPFAWLLRRELRLVHEFEADAYAARGGIAAEPYARLLLRQSFGTQSAAFSHAFFHHPIKQRITMLFAEESSRPRRAARLLTAGLAAIAISGSLLFIQCRQETAAPETTASNDVYQYVEKMPTFNGELNDYLAKSLQYPEAARESGKQGRCVVQFVVRRDGAVAEPKVVKSSGSEALDNEAMRVVRNMPKWKPGSTKGEVVNVLFTLPITFKLDDEPAGNATSFRDVETRRLPDADGHFVCVEHPANADGKIIEGSFSSPGLQQEEPITVRFSID